MNLVEVLLALYFWTGLLFAIAFVARGVECIDPAARRASWGFRLLLVPGATALWPWLLARWVRS